MSDPVSCQEQPKNKKRHDSWLHFFTYCTSSCLCVCTTNPSSAVYIIVQKPPQITRLFLWDLWIRCASAEISPAKSLICYHLRSLDIAASTKQEVVYCEQIQYSNSDDFEFEKSCRVHMGTRNEEKKQVPKGRWVFHEDQINHTHIVFWNRFIVVLYTI